MLDLDADEFAEVRAAVEYIISIFRIPLEAKGMCAASIQDEVEDVILCKEVPPNRL